MVRGLDYAITVFDTAPTGHTLRLLNMPQTMGKAIGKLVSLKSQFGGIFAQVSGMFGMGGAGGADMMSHAEEMQKTIEEVGELFRNPVHAPAAPLPPPARMTHPCARAACRGQDKTTFVCVCTAEFLPLYETERLVQELSRLQIDTHNIVVNQLIDPCNGECLRRPVAAGPD